MSAILRLGGLALVYAGTAGGGQVSATNAASNNAVKIFGLQNERFEKPLFFFHVFLKAGARSTLLDPLRHLFGTHNYRAYNLAAGQQTKLLCDVFSQHRRLHKALALAPILDVIDPSNWKGMALSSVLRHIEELQFEAPLLAIYAQRAVQDLSYREHFLRVLAQQWQDGKSEKSDYTSYIGNTWSAPLHIGLLALEFPQRENWLDSLEEWQERSSYMTQIGPHFGLSRDYDAFVLGVAPALMALVCALMCRIPGAAAYVTQHLLIILERLSQVDRKLSFFAAVWTLHIASASRDESSFERVRKYINERGGIGREAMYFPPSAISIDEFPEEWVLACGHGELVPTQRSFSNELARRLPTLSDPRVALQTLTLEFLTSDCALYASGTGIVNALKECFSVADCIADSSKQMMKGYLQRS
jgi:hypothetical protein